MIKTINTMIDSMFDIIVTMPPYASFIDEVVKHPLVSGIRLNTVMPLKGTIEDTLARLEDKTGEKDLWIDLKCRQLRIKNFGVPPFTEIELTHAITVDTPVTAYFSDGRESAKVVEVDGNRLIMQEGPQRVVGPGESVNIPHPSLKVEGYFTDKDREYVRAASALGIHKYMLSFTELPTDNTELFVLDPWAKPAYKIESKKGLQYAAHQWNGGGRLVAARGDWYVELDKPHHLIEAMETIIHRDSSAIAASRILPSFASGLEPSCQDIGDVDSLLRMGYKSLMLGDDVCLRRESVLSALNLLSAMAEYHERRVK